MTNLMLAGYANLTLYIAMGAYALAMIAFAAHVAVSAARKANAERESEVGSGVTEGAETERVDAELVETAADWVAVGVGAPASSGTLASSGSAGLSDAAVEIEPARADEADAQPPANRGGRAGSWAMSLSWLGTIFLVLSVALRGLSVMRPPLGNMFEFSTFGAMLVMLVFLGMSLKWPLRWLGLFVVGPVLLTLGLAMSVWYTEAAELLPSLKSVWLVIHVAVATLSTALFTLAASVLVLHLLKARQERIDAAAATEGASGEARGSVWHHFLAGLPSARTLDRVAYGLNVVAFPLLTFTLIAGAIWAQQAWGSYWNWDPKEVWTFIVWVIYAAYLHARATSGWSLRTANILALVGYAAIIINFTVVNIHFPGQHSYSGVS